MSIISNLLHGSSHFSLGLLFFLVETYSLKIEYGIGKLKRALIIKLYLSAPPYQDGLLGLRVWVVETNVVEEVTLKLTSPLRGGTQQTVSLGGNSLQGGGARNATS